MNLLSAIKIICVLKGSVDFKVPHGTIYFNKETL